MLLDDRKLLAPLKTITVEVRWDHIQQGVARNIRSCPVALALKEATGTAWTVSQYSLYEINSLNCMLPAPEAVHDFVVLFDTGTPVQPFSFEIALP